MRLREKLVRTLLLVFILAGQPASAEAVPAPSVPNARFYIELPKGGIEAFFRFNPMRIPLVSHHRAGPVPGFPENAIETMDNALRYGFGLMEVDVAQLKDGTLILMHDDTLDRTTTGTGVVSDMTRSDIARLYLKDNEGRQTGFRIPTLEAALKWSVGKAILTLDIKRDTDFHKIARLINKMQAQDYVVAITYSLEQALAFHRIAPDIMLTVSMYDEGDIAAVMASEIDPNKVIAWTGTRQQTPEFYEKIHERGWRTVSGTFSLDKVLAQLGDKNEYRNLYSLGVDIVATDRFWAVQQQIRNPNLFYFVRHSSENNIR